MAQAVAATEEQVALETGLNQQNVEPILAIAQEQLAEGAELAQDDEAVLGADGRDELAGFARKRRAANGVIVDKKKAEKLARFAVDAYNKQGHNVKYEKVLFAIKTPVGLVYNVSLVISDAGTKKLANATVLAPPLISWKLLLFKILPLPVPPAAETASE